MKIKIGVLAIGVYLAVAGLRMDKVFGCLSGQTCSPNALITVVDECELHWSGTYCVQRTSQTEYGCSGEDDFPLSCSAIAFGRFTECKLQFGQCRLGGKDIIVDCCSGGGVEVGDRHRYRSVQRHKWWCHIHQRRSIVWRHAEIRLMDRVIDG
jgi:hypothetical protein